MRDHPEIDWSGLAGVRDIVTHRYFRVDWHLLWISIHEELPVLKNQIRNMKEDHGWITTYPLFLSIYKRSPLRAPIPLFSRSRGRNSRK